MALRVVVAPDKFKGTLTAPQAAAAMAAGVRDAVDDAEVCQLPVADGGDGTVEVLAEAGGEVVEATVTGPLGRPVRAAWVVLGDTAYVESAQACGLRHVPHPDPATALSATTAGVGELVRAALDRGYRRVVLGLGGSATTDGGAGLAVALGARLLDAGGRPVPPGGGGLARLAAVDVSGLDHRLGATEVVLASDVTSPLTGPQGAAAVFAPQKGAGPREVEVLDAALAAYAARLVAAGLPDVAGLPAAGAAGGLGAGAMAFLGARAQPGIDLLLDLLDVRSAVRGADLVLVGEGCLDGQSLSGKAPVGVAAVACRAGVPVAAVAGSVRVDRVALAAAGIDVAAALVDVGGGPGDSPARAAERVRQVTGTVVRQLVLETARGGGR